MLTHRSSYVLICSTACMISELMSTHSSSYVLIYSSTCMFSRRGLCILIPIATDPIELFSCNDLFKNKRSFHSTWPEFCACAAWLTQQVTIVPFHILKSLRLCCMTHMKAWVKLFSNRISRLAIRWKPFQVCFLPSVRVMFNSEDPSRRVPRSRWSQDLDGKGLDYDNRPHQGNWIAWSDHFTLLCA